MIRKWPGIWLLVWLLGVTPAYAQGLALRWQAQPDAPTVGDRIRAELVLTHPVGTTVDWGKVSPQFDGVEAAPDTTEQTVAGGTGKASGANETGGAGHLVSRKIYTLYADLPGGVTLPRVTATVVDPQGGRQPVSANALTLTVTGAFDPDNPPPLAAAKGPLDLPVSWGPYLAGALLVLALLAW